MSFRIEFLRGFVNKRNCDPPSIFVDEFVSQIWRKVSTWSKHVRQDRMLQRAVERTPDESVLLRERVQQQTAKQIEDEQDRVQQRFAERKICSAPGIRFSMFPRS